MRTETLNGKKPKNAPTTGNPFPVPTIEEIRKSVKAQMEVAHYAIGLLLRHPESLNAAADEMYKHVMTKEGGAAIDHVEPNVK